MSLEPNKQADTHCQQTLTLQELHTNTAEQQTVTTYQPDDTALQAGIRQYCAQPSDNVFNASVHALLLTQQTQLISSMSVALQP
jgi:hypothetical protein